MALQPASGAVPIERLPTSEVVAEDIRWRIFTGELRTGDRIPIDAIAAELGVSRLPVREAVMALARDGLVSARTHLGAHVAEFDEAVIRDHFEIVGHVQAMAAARLAAHPDGAVIERLAAIVRQLRTVEDPALAIELTVRFFRDLNAHSGSPRQRSVLRSLGRMLPTGFYPQVKGSVATSRSGVRRLLDAIRSGDPDVARSATLELQRQQAELVIDHLRTMGVFP